MKQLNKHDKIVVKLAIQEALKLGTGEKDYVQFKLGKKLFRIFRLIMEKPILKNSTHEINKVWGKK